MANNVQVLDAVSATQTMKTTDNTGVHTPHHNVDSSVLPTGAATSALQTQPGVDIGDVTVNNAAGASAVNIQDGGNSITVDAASLPLPTGAATSALQTQPGVDIGDVTINNAGGASAVNVQDGGNSITVDGTVAVSGTVTTAESQVLTDNGGFVDGTSKVFTSGYIYDEVAGTALTENDVAAGRINLNRAQVGIVEDGVTRGRWATVTAANAVKVDGSAVTQPISGTVTANAGTGPFPVSDNAGSLTVDAPVGTPVNVQVGDGANTATIRNLAANDALNVAIVDGAGAHITSFGGGTQYTEDAVAATDPVGTTPVMTRRDTPASIVNTNLDVISQQATQYGAAYVQVVSSAGAFVDSFGGGTQYAEDTLHVTGDQLTLAGVIQQSADAALSGDGDRSLLQVDGSGFLKVNIKAGAGSGGTAMADEAAFTEATTNFTPIGGVFNDALASDPTAGQAAAARITSKRALHVNLRGATGTELGTAGAPVRTDPTGTTTQPISAASLPLPTGAATSALQTQPGVDIGDVTVNNAAGASAVNIQDGGNSITIDGSVTVTGTVTTADNQTITDNTVFTDGTSKVLAAGFIYDEVAGTALTENDAAAARINVNRAQVATIEDGVTRGRYATVSASNALKVDGSAVTQPVSGTVTANAGTGPFPVSDNAGSLTVDAPVGTPLFARLSDGSAALTTTGGRLAVDPSGVTSPVSIAAAVTVQQSTASSLKAQVQGEAASGAAKAGNPVQVGGVFNTTQPTVTTGQAVEAQSTARGALIVATGVDSLTVATHAVTQSGTWILGANSGVDIGDVTINNASGASAVNIQDGGNSITVDGTVAVSGTVTTAESQVLTDNGGFTDGTSKVFAAGFIYDEVAGTALTENDVAAGRINVNRAQVSTIEDGATRGRYATVSASNALKVDGSAVTQPVSGTVTANLAAGTNNIGDVDVLTVPAPLNVVGGGTEAAALRVTIANDSTGLVSIDDNGGSLTVDAPVGTPVFARLSDGAAALTTTAGRLAVDPSGVTSPVSIAASVTVAQATASNLNAQVVGSIAHDGIDSGNPVKIGGKARTTNPTAVADADRVDATYDKIGRAAVVVGQVRDLMVHQHTQIASSAAETTILTAGAAGVFHDVTQFVITNQTATAVNVTIKDATAGTTRMIIALAASGGAVVPIHRPMTQAAAANNWTATLSSAAVTVNIWVQAEKNV